MSGAESELSLIDRAVAGDRVALSQLLLLHFDGLHQHVESRISHRLQGLMRADDILQQTFVRAAQAIGTFEPRHPDAFRGWLRTIADNLVRDAEKRRRRERRFPAFLWRMSGGDPPGTTPGVMDQLAGSMTSPSRRVQRGEAVRTHAGGAGRACPRINAKCCGGVTCWGSHSTRLPQPQGGRETPCEACVIAPARMCARDGAIIVVLQQLSVRDDG